MPLILSPRRWTPAVVLLVAGVLRAEVPAVVNQALEATEAVRLSGWAYTMTSTVDGKRTVERHDPAAPDGRRWELVSRDGKPPSDRERRKYDEERRHRGDGGARGVREFIDESSIRVVSDDADRVTCRFRMKADDDEERAVAEKMVGTLVVRRDPASVESLQLVNQGVISKAAVLHMKEFRTHLTFRLDPARGEALPESMVTRMRGRVLLVKSLDVDAEVTFADYRWVGP